MIFKRKPLYYAGQRKLIKWLNEDLLRAVDAAPVVGCWILSTAFWVDSCAWDDSQTWID